MRTELINENIEYAKRFISSYHKGYMQSVIEKYKEMTKDEIMTAIKLYPPLFCGLSSDQIDKDVLWTFLESMVKSNSGYLESGCGKFVPTELKDKGYWQCFCMVNGYNYFLLNKAGLSDYISEKLVDYTLSYNTSYVGFSWMFDNLPDKFKTLARCKEFVEKHFYNITKLPEAFDNMNFYKETRLSLSAINLLVDDKKISPSDFKELLSLNKISQKDLDYKFHSYKKSYMEAARSYLDSLAKPTTNSPITSLESLFYEDSNGQLTFKIA